MLFHKKLFIMAKQKGIIKIKGSMGGLTFYEKDGKSFVKMSGGVDKQKIMTDPAFKRTRENMSEFGGAAKVGKSLRMGYISIINNMRGGYLASRLTGVMKRINTVGTGIRGQRSFEILPNKVLLEGFEFNTNSPLDAVFFAPFTLPTLDANRSVVSWSVPDFDTDSFIKSPEGASHFKLVLAVTVLSNYSYDTGLKSYEPVNPIENETNGIAFSTAIPLGGMVNAQTDLSVDLGFSALLPPTVAVVIAVGIIFYQEINSQLYELASDNAMRIIAIG